MGIQQIKDLTKEELQKLVNESTSISNMLKKLELPMKSFYHNPLKDKMKKFNIDDSMMLKNLKQMQFEVNIRVNSQIPINELLVENSLHARSVIKKRILKNKLIPYKCNECGIEAIWNGKELCLQLDHINGINNDNRKENLRFLCPNCHAQTEGYAGKNKKHKIKKERIKRISKSKISLNKEELELLVNTKTYTEIGKMFQVSGNSIKKRCKVLGILIENRRGYWQKKKIGD